MTLYESKLSKQFTIHEAITDQDTCYGCYFYTKDRKEFCTLMTEDKDLTGYTIGCVTFNEEKDYVFKLPIKKILNEL